MNLQELNELDLSNIGDWPAVVKLILILILCTLVGVGWYFLDIEKQYLALERTEKIEADLRLDFETKQAKAANLQAYREQLDKSEREPD